MAAGQGRGQTKHPAGVNQSSLSWALMEWLIYTSWESDLSQPEMENAAQLSSVGVVLPCHVWNRAEVLQLWEMHLRFPHYGLLKIIAELFSHGTFLFYFIAIRPSELG